MSVIYRFSLILYSFVIRIVSLWNPKAKEWVVGRKSKTWLQLPRKKGQRLIWFHCASLGEFDQGLPLMNAWKEKHPDDFLFVTFFSPSGMQHYHKRDHKVDAVSYIPLDLQSKANKFIESLQPDFVFFVKYEFWHYHLQAAKKSGAQLFSVSSIFRSDQLFFRWYGGFQRRTLNYFDHFFLQDEASEHLLKKISVDQTTVVGDLRFDRVLQNKSKASTNAILSEFVGDQKAWIIGSSWPVDEKLLLPIINSAAFNQKIIIAPHDVTDGHVSAILSQLDKKSIRYTQWKTDSDVQVLVLDTIGHLMNAYQYGDFAYVGGGQTGSLHNILEPAAFDLPVLFGPKHKKFPEANIFLNKGFGFEVSSTEEIQTAIDSIRAHRTVLKEKIDDFMISQTGIADRILAHSIFKV